MLRIVLLAASFAILPQVASAQSLEGVWRGIGQRTIGGPNDGQVIEYDNPRLLIYTDAFFMWAFVTGQGPRPLLPPPRGKHPMRKSRRRRGDISQWRGHTSGTVRP